MRLLLLILSVVTIAACSNQDTSEQKEDTNAENVETEADKAEEGDSKADSKEDSTEEAESEVTDNVSNEDEETEEETTAPPETSEAADETGIHRYELVVEDCTWNQAYNKAKEAGGYLVHINTQEEYDFLLTQVLGSE